MDASRLRSILPYAVGLVVAVVLFIYMGTIDYTPRPGQLGPGTWPRLALGLMAAACVFELARRLAHPGTVAQGIADALGAAEETDDGGPKYPLLLAGGIVLVVVYAALVPVLGFLLATFLFLAAFMYVGRYRRHAAVWAISAIVTILIGILFLRIAYVSLPRGMPPFDRITDAFLIVPGV